MTTKTTTPSVKATKAEAKASMRAVKGFSWEELKDCTMSVCCHASNKSLGIFLSAVFSDNDLSGKEFTGEELAQIFMNYFQAKTGIKPDEKWARTDIKMLVKKGLLKCKIEDKAE